MAHSFWKQFSCWFQNKRIFQWILACYWRFFFFFRSSAQIFTLEIGLKSVWKMLSQYTVFDLKSVWKILSQYVSLWPEVSRIDTRSQYRMRWFLICRSKILISGFHQNLVLQALFCSKTLLLMVKCDVYDSFRHFKL